MIFHLQSIYSLYAIHSTSSLKLWAHYHLCDRLTFQRLIRYPRFETIAWSLSHHSRSKERESSPTCNMACWTDGPQYPGSTISSTATNRTKY
jgi:hypothetical protein